MQPLLRLLGLSDATSTERRATFWTALMFLFAMASTFVLRPVRDQFGVDQGVQQLPWLYFVTLCVTTVFAPAFWWLSDGRPSRRFVPVALQVLAVMQLLLFAGLWVVGDYDWKAPNARWIGQLFWGWFSAFNLAVPTLVWVHAVEHFSRAQALRLFGMVGVGGTAGAVLGSSLSREIAGRGFLPAIAAMASFLLLQAAFLAYRRSARACEGMAGGQKTPRGSVFAGIRLVVRDPSLRSIAGYMLLLTMVVTAYAVARTEIVGKQVGSASGQHGWFANTETWSQSLVLCLQLFVTGRVLRRVPAAGALSTMPLLHAAGLVVLWIVPSAEVMALLTILLRGASFALEKPSREALFTPLDLEAKHKAKFVIDTFMLRLGDWLGALLQVYVLRGLGLSAAAILVCTCVLAAVWGVLGFRLGRRADRPAVSAPPR